MVRRGVVGSVLVLAVLLGARVAVAEETPQQGGVAVLAGGAFGLNGLGAIPGPIVEGHAGGGWRGPRWLVAGLASYAYTESKPLLAYWSITRHDVELIGLVALRPLSPRAFTVHAQLGIGGAVDRLHGVDPETSARALSASFGMGAGWGPAALTFRLMIPDSEVCASSVCHHAPTHVQVVLSVTLDFLSLPR